jgi:glycolate oxidase
MSRFSALVRGSSLEFLPYKECTVNYVYVSNSIAETLDSGRGNGMNRVVTDTKSVSGDESIYESVGKKQSGAVEIESRERIFAELREVVGERFASCATEDLVPYLRDVFSPLGEKFFGKPAMPGFTVCPANTEQVQEVVKIANKYRIPITPVTFGTNMGGLSIPAIEGSMILDLKRLDRIVNIDEESMTATIEPAVSFGRLDTEARKHGLRAVSKIGGYTGGFIGNFVSANMRPHNARGGWTDPVVTLEVVLPTGELLRTGSQAAEGFETLNPYARLSWGPDFVGLFRGSLGAYGIVTRMVVKLYPAGERNEFLMYEFNSLEKLLKSIMKTQRNDIGVSVIGINADDLYTIITDYEDRTRPEIARRIKSFLLSEHSWFLFVELEGIGEKVEVEKRIADSICLKENNGKVVQLPEGKMMRYLRDYVTHRGRAIMHQYNAALFAFWCCMPLSKITSFIRKVNSRFKHMELKDIMCPSEPTPIRWVIIPFERGTTTLCGICIEYDPQDEAQREALGNMVQPLIITMLSIGATIPLTMKPLTNMLMPSYADLMRGIKKLLDPNDILVPDKIC